ncbi:unnamed protein product, partial [Ectocarpus sp. 12 AP-2014]
MTAVGNTHVDIRIGRESTWVICSSQRVCITKRPSHGRHIRWTYTYTRQSRLSHCHARRTDGIRTAVRPARKTNQACTATKQAIHHQPHIARHWRVFDSNRDS